MRLKINLTNSKKNLMPRWLRHFKKQLCTKHIPAFLPRFSWTSRRFASSYIMCQRHFLALCHLKYPLSSCWGRGEDDFVMIDLHIGAKHLNGFSGQQLWRHSRVYPIKQQDPSEALPNEPDASECLRGGSDGGSAFAVNWVRVCEIPPEPWWKLCLCK